MTQSASISPLRLLQVMVLLVVFAVTTTASSAAPFCREVLDAFDFNQGVFAGPDPDSLPNRIQEYVRQLANDHVQSGSIDPKESEYFLKITLNDPGFHRMVAEGCRMDPEGDWTLVDRLLAPSLKPETLTEHRRINANRAARTLLKFLYDACQAYWIDTGGMDACSLPAVSEGGPASSTFRFSPGVELEIENGTMERFRAWARHREGDRAYSVNAEGAITERASAHPR